MTALSAFYLFSAGFLLLTENGYVQYVVSSKSQVQMNHRKLRKAEEVAPEVSPLPAEGVVPAPSSSPSVPFPCVAFPPTIMLTVPLPESEAAPAV